LTTLPAWVKFALRIMKFYQQKVVAGASPAVKARTGSRRRSRASTTAAACAKDIDNIKYLAQGILGRSFCPLGDAAAIPTISIVDKWRNEFEAHLEGRPCPFDPAAKITGLPVVGAH